MENVKTFDSRKRIEFLLNAGEVLNSSLDYHRNLADIALLMTPNLADWCAVDMLDENGDLQRLAVSHVDPEKIKLAYELQERYPPEKDYTRGSYRIAVTGESEFYPFIPPELMRQVVKDEKQYEIMMKLGLRSAISVPLKSGTRIFGVLTLITSDTDYYYTNDDLIYIEELARRAGLAIENSRLYSEAKVISAQMEAQKERLDNILSSIPGLVWEVYNREETERNNFINNYVEQLLGYSVEEWMHDPQIMLNIVHPDDQKRISSEIRIVANGESSVNTSQLRLIRKNGTIVWVETTASTIFNSAGKAIGVRGVTTDISARKKFEERLKLVIESSPNALVMVNEDRKITLVNSRTEKLFGYSREELSGMPVDLLIPQGFGLEENGRNHKEIYGCRKDGTEVPVEIGVSRIRTEEGLFILSSIVDISERRIIEKNIEASLREKEVLLKEIHHRVKNNLQIISSLLNLQSSFLADEKVIDAITESQNRIRSMALIHEKLYQTMDLSKINFKEYTEELVSNLFNSYTANKNLSKEFNIDEIFLNVDLAIALGLIINELVTNSFKYAFPDKEGKIKISLNRNGDRSVVLVIEDNGSGLPENFNIDASNTLGLQLVLSLIDQIDGNIKAESSGGARFKITFPEK